MSGRGLDPRSVAALPLGSSVGGAAAAAGAPAAVATAGELVTFPALFVPPFGAQLLFMLAEGDTDAGNLIVDLAGEGGTIDIGNAMAGVIRSVVIYSTGAVVASRVRFQLCINGAPVPGLDALRVFPNGGVASLEVDTFARFGPNARISARVVNDGAQTHRVGVAARGWAWPVTLPTGELGARS